MSIVKITAEQRKYLRERIDVMFAHAKNVLQDRAIMRRREVTERVMKECGYEKAREQGQKLIKMVEEFNTKVLADGEKIMALIRKFNQETRDVIGSEILQGYGQNSYSIVPGTIINPTLNLAKGYTSVFTRMVDEEMAKTPEGAHIQELVDLRVAVYDRLMLDYEGKTGADIIKEVQESINALVGGAKALPPAKSK